MHVSNLTKTWSVAGVSWEFKKTSEWYSDEENQCCIEKYGIWCIPLDDQKRSLPFIMDITDTLDKSICNKALVNITFFFLWKRAMTIMQKSHTCTCKHGRKWAFNGSLSVTWRGLIPSDIAVDVSIKTGVGGVVFLAVLKRSFVCDSWIVRCYLYRDVHNTFDLSVCRHSSQDSNRLCRSEWCISQYVSKSRYFLLITFVSMTRIRSFSGILEEFSIGNFY